MPDLGRRRCLNRLIQLDAAVQDVGQRDVHVTVITRCMVERGLSWVPSEWLGCWKTTHRARS